MAETPKLHMNEPIWVWLYDFGYITHPEMWKRTESPKLTHPQAHTYAFDNEEDANEHPKKMGWKADHPYVLQKVYLNRSIPT